MPEINEAQIKRLDHAFQLGAQTVINTIKIVTNIRPHHPDFAMDRVIHGVLEAALDSISPLAELTPYKDEADASGTDGNTRPVVSEPR